MSSLDLRSARGRLRSSMPLLGAGRRREAALALIKDGSLPAIGLLVKELVRAKPHVEQEFLALLQELAPAAPAAREVLCQLVVQHDHRVAHRLALASGYAPADPQARALFYFLTEQWEAYETLDFDGRLLHAAYEVVSPDVRERVAAMARRVGRVAWVEVASGGKQGRRLGEMNDVEWKSALLLLFQSHRYEELWRLAQVAPLLWSVRIAELLRRAKWPPPDSPHHADLAHILDLAARCEGDPPSFEAAVERSKRIKAHEGRALSLAVMPDGETLISSGSDGVLRLWNLPSGEAVGALGEASDPVPALALSRDGKQLLSGDLAGRLCLWDMEEQQLVGSAEACDCPVTVVGMTPDKRFAVSGGQDGEVAVWSLPDLDEIARFKTGNPVPISKLTTSPDGTWLACSKAQSTRVWLWRLPDGKESTHLTGCNDAGLAFSNDGSALAAGFSLAYADDEYGTSYVYSCDVALWRVPTWVQEGTLHKHTDAVRSLLWTPGDDVLISGGRDNYVHLWDMPSRRHRQALFRHSADVTRMALDAGGRLLLTGGLYQSARLWDVRSGALLKSLEGYANVLSDFLVLPEQRLVATSDWDGRVVLWHLGPLLLRDFPLNQIELRDLAWLEALSVHPDLSEGDRAWVRFVVALLGWRHRFDIEVEDAPHCIEVGEFDIEIDG